MLYIRASQGRAVDIVLEDIEYVTSTERALLVRYEDEEIWLAIELIEDSGHDWVKIPLWLAKSKGLI